MTQHDGARHASALLPALRLFRDRLLSRSRLDDDACKVILELPGTMTRIRRNEPAPRSGPIPAMPAR